MAQVAILNLGGEEIIGWTDVKHAVTLVWRGKARVHTAEPDAFVGPYPKPRAVELLHYVYARWKYARTGDVPYSKVGVLKRDQYQCAYCGNYDATTVDHVLPKWKGGAASWENMVAACWGCNQKKAGRTPKEANMKLLFLPRTPSFNEAWTLTH